ncbi:hypothetical protein yinte0001_33830 [Yersinia intermedia ATCC 29909]|nr:hypothetical protein yinte0001_33830 [Yersinia intermedia ATCC 29909]
MSESASLLSGEGMISFPKLPVVQLIQVAIKRNLPVFWLASGQMGV